MFDQRAFLEFVIDSGVVGLFKDPVILNSGRESHWYVNWRKVFSDVYLMEKLVNFVLGYVRDKKLEVDTFHGVREGATKPAVILSYINAINSPKLEKGSHTLSMGRGKPKTYGMPEDAYFLGVPKGRCVLLEDTTTTGKSMIDELYELKRAGSNVTAAISLTDRLESTPIPGKDNKKVFEEFAKVYKNVTDEQYERAMGVRELIEKCGLSYYSMSDARGLLHQLIERNKPNKEIIEAIEREYEKFGAEELELGVGLEPDF